MPYQTNALSLGYSGELTDPNGLVYLRARVYAPMLGVFLSRDPVEGVMERVASRNGYGYVEGNPVNYTDPSGECFCPTGYGPSSDGKSCISLTNSASDPIACPGAPDPILTNPPKLSFPHRLATGQAGNNIAVNNFWAGLIGCVQYQIAAAWSHVERLPLGRTIGGVASLPKWTERAIRYLRMALSAVKATEGVAASEAESESEYDPCSKMGVPSASAPFPTVDESLLMVCHPDAALAIALIRLGGPFPTYPLSPRNPDPDNKTWSNDKAQLLGPSDPGRTGMITGFREYTVPPGIWPRGQKRIVTYGPEPRSSMNFTDMYFTADHYKRFWQVNLGR